MQPRPRWSEHNTEQDRTNRECDERQRHHPRAFVCMLRTSTPITEEDVDNLPRHVERGEYDADKEKEIGQARNRPMRRYIQDFLLRPTAGKEERHSAESHHADCIS